MNAGLEPIFQPVSLATNINHMGVMQQPVKQGRSNHSVAEQLAPVAEVFVAGQDDASVLVAFGHQPEEKLGLLAA